jgi:Heterokaryon incompatibility protein (HET)
MILKYHPHASYGETNTSSAAHMSLIKHWLYECPSHHIHCRMPKTGFMPKRLVAIEYYPSIRIRLTGFEEGSSQYYALSHFWGGAADIPVFTAENFESRVAGISVDELPKSFKDAIKITRTLRVEFLWIDCLCIIQDSVEEHYRISRMGLIYEEATCSILAAGATNAHEGCFWQRKPLLYAPCGDDTLYANDCRLLYTQKTAGKPSFKGAWAFQEQFLSTRVLEFNKFGVKWRCKEGNASELKPSWKRIPP